MRDLIILFNIFIATFARFLEVSGGQQQTALHMKPVAV
jgi:hypothetical protein